MWMDSWFWRHAMASETQETLYRIFESLSGGLAGAVPQAATSAGSDVARTIETAVAGGMESGLSGGLLGSVVSAAAGSSEKKGGGGAGEVALDVAKSGLGLVPLASLIFGLFGGGEEEKPPALVKYALPARRAFSAAETASGLADVDYDQSGRPRVVDGGGTASAGAAPQITVNVQAMDARSFLDRSTEIAAAVRDAMLHLNSINDVVTDL
jgi:hypothetical protein